MSNYISISREPHAAERLLWVGSGTMLDLRDFFHRYSSPLLKTDAKFEAALLSCPSGAMRLCRCSEKVRLEAARLILEGSMPEHEFWETWDGRYPNLATRNIFKKLADEIVAGLQDAEERRNLLTPHQRLCAALRFRAADRMNEFLETQGIKPHELSRIKERIDRGEWPAYVMDYLPGLQRYFMQRMMER